MASRATAIPLPALRIDRVVDPKSRVFQLTASNDGVSIFIPHPRFWWRNTVRFMKRARSKMQQAFAPLPLTAVFFSPAGLLGALYVIRHRNPQFDSVAWKVLERIQGYLPFAKRVHPDLSAGYVAIALTSVGIGGLTAVHRLTLRFVLSYTGWIDEGRGPKSLRTKMWAFLLRYVYIRGSLTPTYALQNCLPRLPVPPLQATMDRYLASMEPVLSPDELREVKEASAKFVVTEGPKLQRFLKFKYYTSRNYVSDWWLQVVYLRGRESLLINSNYYGIALYREPPTRSQAARAAVLTHAMLQVKASLDRELFPRTVLQDTVPLCMHQYVGIFGTTREPGSEIDRLTQYDSTVSRHVVVLHKGSFYKVYAVNPRTGHSLTRVQLYAAFQGILDAGAQQGELPREALFASLTTLPRTEWAEVRSNLVLRDTINRLALQAIEEALFCVCLDDQPGPWMDLTACGRRGIHGGGANLWLDKSFNVIITSDANVLCNAEHSWADAPTLSHVTELALQVEAKSLAVPGGLYAADGSIIATPEEQRALASGTLTLYAPERLVFNMTPLLTDACNRAFLNATKLINNLDLCCARFSDFGKGLIKKVKCSPDAFVQVALQLAYFRDQGRFVQTYESGTARLFLEGRTETIRSASTESVALVRAFSDARISKDEKLKLLRTACEKHQRTTALAMTGRGVDRHLFALYVVAVGTGVDSPFLSTAMRRGWKLSTSQIPQAVQDFVRPGDGEEWVRPAGGFGPVAEDGYGVCYTVSGETSLFFHVSCNRSCPTTDAARMQQRIAEALRDLASLVA